MAEAISSNRKVIKERILEYQEGRKSNGKRTYKGT